MMRNLFAAFVASVIFMGTAFGQAYPAKPISIVISFGPGGGTDLLARALAQAMEADLGQPIVVLNKPGGNSIIAADFVKNSPPDGYTLLLAFTDIMVLNPLLYSKLSYSPERDFVPISQVGAQGRILIAGPNAPAKTLPGILDFARANPGKVKYGTAALGAQLLGDMIKLESKVDMLHIPYKGSAGTIQAVLSGDVDFLIVIAVPISSYVNSGQLFGIAATAPKREGLIPSMPTMRELGYPALEDSIWYGLFAPAGTPQPIIDKLNAATQKAVENPDVVKRFYDLAAYPSASSPEHLTELIRSDVKRWGRVIKEVGLKLE